MIGLRDARYCNLKLFLIYLVLYGHWIEAGIDQSSVLMVQYRWIYSFHMPLFAFLSGLFLTRKEHCLKQCKRTFFLYLLLQSLSVMFGKAKPWTPYWHLWYLLSYTMWSGLGYLWFRHGKGRGTRLILILSIALGCAVGYISAIGRMLSLSRTIVFFPYFWAGLLCCSDQEWKRLRMVGILAFGFGLAVLGAMEVPVHFFYQADSYDTVQNGALQRLLCYVIGAAMCLFLLAFIPDKRFPFSKAGADTMPAYLLHAPIILFLREREIPWLLCPILCAVLLYMIFKLQQWNRNLYGIVTTGERGTNGSISRGL